ncbi:MAG: OsmC family protein [Anaerolineaceae bacterium]|jgi:putative redox protein|nr:OsmC family protein [Anaerolineaceae bacterium]MDD4043463.1 OsmC family protein [Anaerolineaceae bacterium]MDD4578739.1 OsmC family protein [Anaerolineaceae bacterium]
MGTKLNVTAELNDKYRVGTKVAGHEYVMDEPIDAGGDDTGTVPGAMLGVALAGCKAMVARVYADKCRIPLRKVEVEIEMDFEQTESGIDLAMNADIVIDGDLTEKQMEGMTKFLNEQCPVQKILSQPNKITSTVSLKEPELSAAA